MAQCEELPNSKVVPQHRQPPVQGPGAPTPRNFPKGTVITPRFLPNLILGELSPGPSVPLSGNQSVTLHEDPPPTTHCTPTTPAPGGTQPGEKRCQGHSRLIQSSLEACGKMFVHMGNHTSGESHIPQRQTCRSGYGSFCMASPQVSEDLPPPQPSLTVS